MKKKFVVYLTLYSGTKLPKWYIGSSYESKVLNGYNGSVSSKKYKSLYLEEQKNNKPLFKTRILSYHDNDLDARTEELRLQKMHKVVNNVSYFNESYAQKDGFFGMNVEGENHPRFGTKHSEKTKEKIKQDKKNKFDSGELNRSGENNAMFGKVSIMKNNDFVYIDVSELEIYEANGYVRKGKPKTNEMKQKISKTLTGRNLPEQHKNNISIGMQGKQNTLGKKCSEETKDKLSKQSSGRIWIINEITGKTKFVHLDKFIDFDGWQIGRKLKEKNNAN